MVLAEHHFSSYGFLPNPLMLIPKLADRAPHVRFSIWNRAMETLTGYTMAEINRLGWYQTVYRDPAVQERARLRMERMRCGEDLVREMIPDTDRKVVLIEGLGFGQANDGEARQAVGQMNLDIHRRRLNTRQRAAVQNGQGHRFSWRVARVPARRFAPQAG